MRTLCDRRIPFLFLSRGVRWVNYIQGQSPEPRVREYFYYIDHQGQLFLDDARIKNFTSCFKEKAFLEFFYKRLRINNTDRYEEFPYLSLCGRERNFIRCDDRPIVYLQIAAADKLGSPDMLTYGGYGANLKVLFQPEKICMLPETGRVYHPASRSLGGVGLIKSSLAIELSRHFEFHSGETNPPTHFNWKGERYTLTNEIIPVLNEKKIAN